VQLAALLLDADREGVDAALGHQALAQRLEDVLDVSLGQWLIAVLPRARSA
jgi:hypothetical protein